MLSLKFVAFPLFTDPGLFSKYTLSLQKLALTAALGSMHKELATVRGVMDLALKASVVLEDW